MEEFVVVAVVVEVGLQVLRGSVVGIVVEP